MASRSAFGAGEAIFFEGQPGDCAYIIERGAVDIVARVDGKPDVVIGRLGPGDLFGEMALIDMPLRSATAVAREETELLVIPRSHFEARIDVTDRLVRLFLQVLMERYREMRGHFQAAMSGTEKASPVATGKALRYADDASSAKRRLEAETALRQGFERGELELFYQPIMSLADGRVAGCESLIRWRSPSRGLVPPGEFIGLAEESGLIVPIGRWILGEACSAWQRFRASSKGSFYMSINLSGRQFEDDGLVGDVRRIFAETGIEPAMIKLEITETLLMADPHRAAEMLTGLKATGAQIALDDFGTGYSSFAYLHRFPIDALKIDRAFVSTMRENAKSREIVRTLCDLARSIGMAVIAEGIESAEEAEMLRGFSAEFGQGYHFAKPLPAPDFLAFLGRNR